MKRKAVLLFSVTAFYSFLYTLFFSATIFSNGLLAPGDGSVYYLPNFFSKGFLWEPLIFSGFPVIADPQAMSWYPVSVFFALIHSWNAFVLAAYVLASCFVCGYVLKVTQSRFAGLVAGVIYGMSGFMMAHLGHSSMIHTAVWMPLFIWALEELYHNFTIRWLAIAVLSLTLSVFAGHPQILFYTIGLGAVYVLFRGFSGASIGRWRYYGVYLLILLFGVSLAAIQLFPANELKDLGMRSQMSFDEFAECSFPPAQAVTLLFPYLFGGTTGSLYPPYFGSCNIHELSGYVGLLPFLVAAAGFLAYRKKSIVLFWFSVGLFAFLLTLGDATPLAKLMYKVPVYNKFRGLARHFLEMTLAVSVLAGFGVAAVENQAAKRKMVLRIVASGAGIVLLALGAVYFSHKLDAHALQYGAGKISLLRGVNPAIAIPLVLLLCGSFSLIYFHGHAQSYFRKAIFILILIVDLSSFGWFTQWKYVSPDKGILKPTVLAEKYKGLLDMQNQRLFTIRGGDGDLSEMPPNTSRLWGMPSASGYNPLILSRVRELLSMKPAGIVSGLWSAEFDRSLDIMAIRYVFMLHGDTFSPKFLEKSGFSWTADNAPIQLGSCNNPHSDSITFNLPVPVDATAIGIVSAMACSAEIKDDAEVVRIKLTGADGSSRIESLLSGRDTSEWRWDCDNETHRVKHRRAAIFDSWPVQEGVVKPCEGHKYLSVIPLKKTYKIKSMELRWVAESGTIGIKKISLLDEPSGRSYPLFAANASLADVTRWRHAEDFGGTSIYENIRAMPRAWMVSEVLSAKPEEVLYAVKTSGLPDGRTFDPAKTALIEEPLSFKGAEAGNATVQVVQIDNASVEIHTESSSASFLVLSDIYYPGWQATIDGNRTHIFQTNYVLRGVMVPSGGHIVRFEFKPKSLYMGAGISVVSLLLFIGICSVVIIRRRKQEGNRQ